MAEHERNTQLTLKQMRATREAAVKIYITHAKNILFISSIPPAHGDRLFSILSIHFKPEKKSE